jgi:four helix bundle protein
MAVVCCGLQWLMRKAFPFERLEVWQTARLLVKEVYQSARSFPKEDMFGITSQLKRASISVANNLAEGSARASLKDQAHFTSQSHGSLMETACDLILANDLGFMTQDNTDHLLDQAYDLSVRIHNLRESQLKRAAQS